MTLLKLRLKKLRGLSLIIYLWMTKTAQNVEPVYDKCQCQTMLHFRSDTPLLSSSHCWLSSRGKAGSSWEREDEALA